MENEPIPQVAHESWHPYLQPLMNNQKMKMIREQVLPNYKFYPEAKDIFKVFSTPLNKIKVVILGQDPYPKKGEATGLAFAVPRDIQMPPSLKVIKDEIITTKVERDAHTNIDSDRWRELLHWKAQGIFLLNIALTVESMNSGSHINLWQWFTNDIIKIISSKVAPIWLLWGAKAKGYRGIIKSAEALKIVKDNTGARLLSNEILEADHPASGTYPGSRYTFTGCNHFVLCNKRLKENNQSIINW